MVRRAGEIKRKRNKELPHKSPQNNPLKKYPPSCVKGGEINTLIKGYICET
jgi:hypothetical protein